MTEDEASPPVDSEVAGDDTATPSNQAGGETPSRDDEDVADRAVARREAKRQRMLSDPRFAAQRGRWKSGGPKPAGKPKSLPRFRKRSRVVAFEILAEIQRRIGADVNGEIPMGDLVRAYTELADRGGFMRSKEESDIELVKARLLVAAMAIKELTEESRKTLLGVIDGGE